MDMFGVPVGQLLGTAGGWLAAVGFMTFVVRKIVVGDLVPKATHEKIVSTAVDNGDNWRTAYFGLSSVLGETTSQNTEWLEVARLVKDFIAAQERADAIEAALRRGDKP